ncbi:hypothetical protein QQ045_004370 [Rhodiola kirilowii]
MEPVSSGNDGIAEPNNAASSSTPKIFNTLKVKGKNSDVWKYFVKHDEVENGKKVQKAECNFCKKKLACCGNAGTSHLSRHAKSHINALTKGSDIRNQLLLGKDKDGLMGNFQYDHVRARSEYVYFIIRAELPFSFVDTHDFAGMIQRGLAPQFKKFSSYTCKRDVMKRFNACKLELISYFDSYKGRICLTSDMWSSRQKMGYMSLTAHWIDDKWNMQKRILSFKMVEYPHTGDSLASHMYEELIAWHLHDKVFTLTLDNASSNDVLVTRLASHLMLTNVSNQLLHVRCTCHILNLIVQDGLSVLSPSIEKITTIVRSMNSSIKRHELWVSSCAELGLSKRNIDNDVPHRWNSTYELLNVVVKYKTAMHRYCQKVNESRNCAIDVPSEHDWVIASLCMNFLKIFCSTTKVCSGVYSPTSNKVINSLVDIYATFKAYHPLDAFRPTLDAMKLKFNKYWDDFPMIFCLATVVDLRFKLLAIETWLSLYDLTAIDIEIKVSTIRSVLNQLFEVYKRNLLAASCPMNDETARMPASVALEPEIDVNIPVVPSASMARLKRARVSSSGASTDLQIYLDLDTLDVDDNGTFNILDWWKANSSMYPALSIMARDLLSIPASTVASEAAFSAWGQGGFREKGFT